MILFEHYLILNHITGGESMPPFNKTFESYREMAHLFLSYKGLHLFESDILENYSPGVTLEKLMAQSPDRFVPGANYEKDGVRQKTWYDLWSTEEIVRGDTFFDYFFICKLRHQSLLTIDEFLSFHLDYSFESDKPSYYRFLQLSLRQHEDMLSKPVIDTVQEWIEASKTASINSGLENDKPEKIKGRLAREAGDRLTCLNLNQTALLIEYLQQAGIILRSDYLNYTQAGKAFHLLTGYSAHSLRMQLGAKGSVESVIKFEDYRELYDAVKKLAALIEPKTKSRK